jgi:type I restriction-modification system DNA methylase subunit
MAKLDIPKSRDLLQKFDFPKLFIEQLGWENPPAQQPVRDQINDFHFAREAVASLAGVMVFEIAGHDGRLPDAKTRAAIHKAISRQYHENLLIFLDRRPEPTQSLWYWAKRVDGKAVPREHLYFRGQPGDLFISKLAGMVVDISELDDEGRMPVVEAARRLQAALDIERVTKKFYREFYDQHIAFLEQVDGIPDERDRRWYASVLLNRLMFIWFLQGKGFIDKGDTRYLSNKLAASRARGKDLFFADFLKVLFFEGFSKPKEQRSAAANKLLGEIRYLNGGLFLQHRIESQPADIRIPDAAFENLFALFSRYSWNLNDIPGGKDDEINPDVLGYIFEKYINQKAFGAYYTRPEITEYLCEHTIYKLILDAVNEPAAPALGLPARAFGSVPDLLINLDSELCKHLLHHVLPKLTLLDPACGSGAFLVAAMKTLINLYSAIIGRIKFLNDPNLSAWLKQTEAEHPNLAYWIKKSIITDNLFGADIMEEATEIAKLRLFLALVASAQTVEQLEPLPNIDFNILAGNSLVGLMRIEEEEFNHRHDDMFRKSYRLLLEEKNRLIDTYRHATSYAEDLRGLRDSIETHKREANEVLDELLLEEFSRLGVQFEQAAWDAAKNKEARHLKRKLALSDIKAQRPFHWGYEFDEIMQQRGGFDAIITNPPWEIFKPQAKEFFVEHSDLVTKNKMTIKEFEKEQAKLLRNSEVRKAWLEYQSRFPHMSAYFRASQQYANQSAVVNGKKTGTDINLYKLFLEQCYNLLREGGECGIILQSGIYTDLGAKGLRDMLFAHCKVEALLGFSNERFIFEGVHHAQKFCLLVFGKGGATNRFSAAFRINPREAVSADQLERFLNDQTQHIDLTTDLVRRLSPDSHSVMEFKSEMDIHIAEKMLKFPLLGKRIDGAWNLALTREFDMTNDSHLFKTEPGKGRLPLYEGKMIWQFDHRLSDPRFWVVEREGRTELLGRDQDIRQVLDYQVPRIGIRSVASNTNERSLIATIIPPNVFCGNSVQTTRVGIGFPDVLTIASLLNSFPVDWMLRNKVSQNINFFYLYQLPVPRLHSNDAASSALAIRAAKLICIASEFDELAKQVGLKSHREGVTDPAARAKLRAELDGLIAHLYGLTEEEFAHILSTFPLVPDAPKAAALTAFRDVTF